MKRFYKFRCYLEKQKDSWFAICIDLNIYARAGSEREVREKLHVFIKEYLDEAFGEDFEYIRDLVPRRAPLYFQIKWYVYYTVTSLLKHCRPILKNVRTRSFREKFAPSVLRAC